MIDIQINRFAAGVDYDTAEGDIKNDKARNLINARVINVDGQGFVVVPYGSTEQKFALSDGYYPVGACTYNGIAYIFSTNGTNGEIGTYPSPVWAATFGGPCGPGFVDAYSPLRNFLNANSTPTIVDNRDPFNTDLLRLDKQVECFARLDFDDTVNIYFTDDVNPIRKINSGFTQDGFCGSVDRAYSLNSFPGNINLLKSTCVIPVFGLPQQGPGGSLKCGNTFLYLRYVNSAGTKTDFVSSSSPIQIGIGNGSDSYRSYGSTGDPLSPNSVSNNKIDLTISNLDTSFSFFEIGVIRYYNGVFETYLIDNKYPITNASEQLQLNGSEKTIALSIDEILSTSSSFDIAKTICQVQNRLWAGNVTSSAAVDPRMIELARAIVARPSSDIFEPPASGISVYKFEEDAPYAPAPPSGNQAWGHETGHHIPDRTYDSIGYFRSEPYQFGIVFVSKNGKETPAIPVRGYDAWFNPGPAANTDYNYDGVLRMPSNHQTPYLETTGGIHQIKKLGVFFSWIIADPNNANQTAFDIYNNNIDYFTNEICGWYFVRSERRPTIDSQGPIHGCYAIGSARNASPEITGYINDDSLDAVGAVGAPDTRTTFANRSSLLMPRINNRIVGSPIGTHPMIPSVAFEEGSTDDYYIVNNFPQYRYYRSNRYGVFSQDHQLGSFIQDGEKSIIIQNYYRNHTEGQATNNNARTPIGDTGFFTYWRWYLSNIYDHAETTPISAASGIAANMLSAGTVKTIDLNSNDGEFSSVFNESELYRIPTGAPTTLTWYNRAIATRKFLAVSYNPSDPDHIIPAESDIHPDVIPISGTTGRAIVNIYKIDPRPIGLGGAFDINTWYNFRTNIFYKITPLLSSTSSGWVGGGDCFIQRSYSREVWDNGTYPNDIAEKRAFWGGASPNPENRYWTYGTMYGIVTENTYNVAMRGRTYDANNNLQNNFFQLNFYDTPYVFSAFMRSAESIQYNVGYHKVLDAKGIIGIDPTTPLASRRLNTRIMFSEFHYNQSGDDGYSYIKPANYRDFDYQYGSINKIAEHFGTLMSVQDSAISLHYINERTAITPDAGRQVIIGNGDVLNPIQKVISSGMGSQHQWSIIASDGAKYGVDVFKRKIWRVIGEQVEAISDSKNAKSKITGITRDFISDQTDIANRFPDQPAFPLSLGIASYFDRRHKEIGWTFITRKDNRDRKITIVFNENIDAFQGENTYNSRFYITNNSDFISFDPDNLEDAYMHDIVSDRLYYYDRDEREFMEVDFVSNKDAEFPKIFDNVEISSFGFPFNSIEFYTEYQQAIKPWNEGTPYKDPVWIENKWKVPVPRTQASLGPPGSNLQYFQGSRMRGKWMRVKLKYNLGDKTYIRDIITKQRISHT